VAEYGCAHDYDIFSQLLDANLIVKSPPPKDKWGWDVLSKIFHLGTQNRQDIEEAPDDFVKNYVDNCTSLSEVPHLFLDKVGSNISLPDPELNLLEAPSFYSVLKNRKTCRNFTGESISITKLSTLLFSSFGLIHGYEWNELTELGIEQAGYRTAAASSGSLHVEDAYVLVYNVTNLQPGLYYYHAKDHKLIELHLGDLEEKVMRLNFNQFFSSGLAVGIYIMARFDRSWWKYKHSCNYRINLLDIGYVAQNLQLCATALELQTWITDHFLDEQVSKLLMIDGMVESPLLFVGAGIGTNAAVPDKFRGGLK
jgi:SagB-type dehydrogenase family enzyme